MTSSAHSKGIRFASLIAAVCVGVVAFSACTKKEITGDDWKNVPPTVRFVNIPPDSSSFSANPIIYWNGTDVDGRVVSYRYVVITKAEITASGLTPEQYIVNKVAVPDSRWTVLPVSLENPQASARVPLQADLSDPVRKVVQQYVFLQAKDDEGAYSQIVYRFYGRNAHFPETALTPFGLRPYINVQRQIRQEGFVFGGVTATWIGTDSLDFQGEQPAMQYEWRLYGPYNAAESLRVVSNFIGFVFRTTDHIYEIGDTLFDTTFDYSQFDIDSSVSPPETTVHVLDADTIRIDTANKLILGSFGTFDTTLRIDSILAPGPNTLNRLVESSYNPLTGQPWTDSVQGLFLDVFRNDPALAIPGADTTRIGTFIFWVRTRDDASVADPTPAFALFNVVEPRHERDLMVIDMSQAVRGRNVNAQSLGGEDIGCANYLPQFDTNKRVISEYVESWRSGSVGPNNQFLFDTGTFQPCGEDSMILPIGQRSPPNCSRPIYQPSRTAPDYVFARALPSGSPYFPTSRDMLKHKVVIFIKDNIIAPLVRGGSEEQELITNGVATGVNIWSMSRASFQETPFNTLQPYFGETSPQGLPGEYAFIFGIRGYFWQAWYGMAIERVRYGLDSGPPLRNEDFVGTYPLPDFVDTTLYPRLSLDTDLLRRRLRWEKRDSCEAIRNYPYQDSIASLPEVGYIVRTTATPLYLYRSRFGQDTYPYWPTTYDGRVVAVRNDFTFFRTSHWCFTPFVLEKSSFQTSFNNMIDWLFEPWGGPGSLAKGTALNQNSTGSPQELAARKFLWRSAQDRNRRFLEEAIPGGVRPVRNFLAYQKQYENWAIRHAQEQSEGVSAGPSE